MASRKLVRDFLFSKQMPVLHFRPQQAPLNPQLRMACLNGYSNLRCFSVFNEFSKKVKGEASSNQDFQQSMKELKEKAEERAEALKEVKEDLKIRTKQTTEQLYKQVDGVWTEAEAAAKKVSADMKEKIAAATDEVKEKLGLGKQDSPGSTCGPTDSGTDAKDGNRAASASENSEDSESFNVKKATGASDTLFGRLRSGFSSSSPKVSMAFQRFKDTKVIDFAKKGYDIVKDEFSSNPNKRRRIKYADAAAAAAAASPKEGTSSKTDMVVVPTKQSRWSKKWEAVKEKMQGHPLFKRLSGYSEPVVTKGQELAEDMRERWETSDNPVVHKIQDWNETVFGETAAALSFKEIRRRDPSFSLPEFVAEVQEMIRPTLNAYLKGDVEALKKNCSPEVIERCRAEHRAYESQGIFFDNKILHISDVEVRETKLMGTSPIIIVAFQTQQVYCVRDRYGSITEGGKDTIHTVYYAWAMQQIDVEELGEGAFFPIWRLREMQQLGIQALI